MTAPLDPTLNLAIDWGNTRLKAGWFIGDQLQETARYASPDDLRDALQRQPPQHVIVSSTSRPADELRLALDEFDGGADWLLLSPTLPVPVRNGYETPQTLGADRLAAAAGVAAPSTSINRIGIRIVQVLSLPASEFG